METEVTNYRPAIHPLFSCDTCMKRDCSRAETGQVCDGWDGQGREE